MFERGHLDHLSLNASSEAAFSAIRDRLRARDATEGVSEDLGAFHSVWFYDPDGIRVELVHVVNDRLEGIHGPRPLEPAV